MLWGLTGVREYKRIPKDTTTLAAKISFIASFFHRGLMGLLSPNFRPYQASSIYNFTARLDEMYALERCTHEKIMHRLCSVNKSREI